MSRSSRAGAAVLAALSLAACETSITGGIADGTASMTVLFAPLSGPSTAPAAQSVMVTLADTVSEEGFDTMLVASPGDTIVLEDLPAGVYELAMEATTTVATPAGTYVVWTSQQRVILAPDTVARPVVTPDAFEVTGFATSSTLPLTAGESLDLTWNAVPRAAEYRVSWSDGAGPVSDTITAGTSVAVVLDVAGTYTVSIQPRTEAGADGWPVDLSASVVVTN